MHHDRTKQCLMALSLAFPTAAAASDVSSNVEEIAAAAEQEIVVVGVLQEASGTGSKTGTDPRDLPAAVVVIPEAILEAQDVRTLDDALTNSSAVAPNFAGGYGIADNYVVRGLPVRFLRDGLPDGPSFMGYRRTLADVASIEVLKGPGSALYGRAEAGGSINIVTHAPRDDWGVEASASYGSFDAVQFIGDVGGPIAEAVDTRLIGSFDRTSGYRGLERRSLDLLPTVAIDLGTDHRLTLDYDHRDARATIDNYGIPFTLAGTLAPIDRRSRLYSPFNRADQTIDRLTVADSLKLSSLVKLRAALIYDVRDIKATRNAGANPVSAAGIVTGRGGRTQADDARYTTAQVEAVLTPVTGAVGHTILLGVEYARADVDTVRRNYVLPNLSVADGGTIVAADPAAVVATSVLGFDRAITSDTWSIYAQEQADIADRIKIRAGVRYDHVKLVDEGRFGNVDARIAGTSGLVSWQAGAVFQPSAALSLYTGYSRGKFLNIQTESANLSSNFAARADPVPESSSQIEAGAKARLFGGRLDANFALFRTTRNDFFVALSPGADPVQIGRQRSQGVELDIVGAPIEGLSVIANAAYVDAENRSAALASVAGIAANRSTLGKRLASTPRLSGSIWANYTVPAGVLAGFGFGSGVVYKGTVFADALELLKVPGYAVARAAVSYTGDRFEAQLTVNNLTDADYYTKPTFIGALPGDPRTVQLTLRSRF